MEDYTLDEFLIILDEYNDMQIPESEKPQFVTAEDF